MIYVYQRYGREDLYFTVCLIADFCSKSDEVMNGVLEVIMNQEFKKSFVGILGKITIRQCLT